MSLIDDLIKDGWLKTERIIQAFQEIKREDFLPAEIKDLAEQNTALPIDYGQTISQPLTVAFMLELLQPKPGDKILDIGSGSGWTTALLAYVVSQKGNPKSQIPNPKQIPNSKFKIQNGRIIAIEIIPGLVEFGKKNVLKYNYIKKGIVEFVCADGSKGFEKQAPYDKILVSAEAEKISEEWKKQLKIGGRLVAPIKNSIWLFEKVKEKQFKQIEYPGFVFVPLVEKNNQ